MKNLYVRIMAIMLFVMCVILPQAAHAKPATIIFIPLDNRPVCKNYAEQTMRAAGYNVIMPPTKLIASHDAPANPEALLEWLTKKAPSADAAVISTDALIYGGLVESRTHHVTEKLLRQRLKRVSELKTVLPIKIYAFSTIMRTPRASFGNVEPHYYEKLGPAIFAYSGLTDKAEQKQLTPTEALTKQALEANIPRAELEDWLTRRQTNLNINFELIRLAANKRFHYLAVGKDDNAPLSATHMEARKLSFENFNVSPDSFQIIDGVDQLGLLLLTRAHNDIQGNKPFINVVYGPGRGSETLPQYSDSFLRDSVPQQIAAAGGQITSDPAQAQFILAINTPENGIVKDSTADDNQFFASQANRLFTSKLTELFDAGYHVSLADISYSNGSDNGFMNFFMKNSYPEKLKAYNGWNTADNTIGYAIAQGILSERTAAKKLERQLAQRLVDDWFYQSNARRTISELLKNDGRSRLKYNLGNAEKAILSKAEKECRTLAHNYNYTKRLKFEITFPWHRLFEAEIKITEK